MEARSSSDTGCSSSGPSCSTTSSPTTQRSGIPLLQSYSATGASLTQSPFNTSGTLDTNFTATPQSSNNAQQYVECLVRLIPPKKPLYENDDAEAASPIEKFRSAVHQVIEQQRKQSQPHDKTGLQQTVHVVVDIGSNDGDSSTQGSPTTAPEGASNRPRLPWHKRLVGQLVYELMVIGESVCRMLTPAELGHHWVLFSPCLFVSLSFVFAFMAAQLPYYLAWHTAQTCLALPVPGSSCFRKVFPTDTQGPAFMMDWLSSDDTSPATDFTFEFLNAWGARYAPLMAEQPQRWLTSLFVHANVLHLVGNLAVLMALAIPLERRFGCIRVFVVFTLSVIGGGLLSAAVETPCTQVLGASGGIFGLLGMFAAEFALERQYLPLPIYRAVMVVVFTAIFIGTVFTQPGVSHISHLGGFICGMLPTFLFLPNKFKDMIQKLLPIVGLISVLIWFSVLPYWVYVHVLPGLQCDAK